MSKADELLFLRELRGLKILTLFRATFVAALILAHWIVAQSELERLSVTAMGLTWELLLIYFLYLIRRGERSTLVGFGGAAMDVVTIACLPIIWYLSVGGDAVPPAYMLKTMLTATAIGLVVLNSLAIRPLYPIIVALGAALVHLALLGYVLEDQRTTIATDFVDAVMGPDLSLDFVGTAILITLIAGGESMRPGGRIQDVAVMFCDIRGFTALSETMSPADVAAFLSEYHGRMVDEVFRFGGTIDKFIGDAIMVTFGTPDTAPDDAERAVLAGLAMKQALTELNRERRARDLPEIRQGMGIHYGPVIAGNIGTAERLEYTVIGDTVNTASRIEGACKELSEDFLISGSVQCHLGADTTVRPLTELTVRGRSEPVQIYAVDPPSDRPDIAAHREKPDNGPTRPAIDDPS